MRLLELFCGTKSVGKVFNGGGWDVVSVDILKEFEPTYCQSVLDLDLRIDISGKFDVIWASPPCTTFSIASVSHHWKNGVPSDDRVIGNALLAKTLEIINLKQPKYWFIENPRGMMRKLPIIQYLPRYTVTYCQYGDNRMKPTDIWTNCTEWKPKPMCKNGDTCHESAPRGARTGTQGLKLQDKSAIPYNLVREIFECVNKEASHVQQKREGDMKPTKTRAVIDRLRCLHCCEEVDCCDDCGSPLMTDKTIYCKDSDHVCTDCYKEASHVQC